MDQLDEYIAEAMRCPSCGENEIDKVVWDKDGERVECQTCGAWYDPEERV